LALTDAQIKGLKPKAVRYLVTDGRVLAIEALPSGRLSWLYRYRFNRKPEKVFIGGYPDISLKAARQKRDEFATMLASGKSPAQFKKLSRQGASSDPTVKEFGERWFREVACRDRKDTSHPRRYLENEIYPTLGSQLIKDVTAEAVQGIVFRKRDHGSPAAAAAIRNQIKRVFDYAIVCGVAASNPALATPTRFITGKKSRKRALKPDEIRVYLQTLYRSNVRRQFKLGLHLILLTLVRKSELLFAKWKDVDLEGGEWTIPAENTKTGEEHTVYVSREAAELFCELKMLAGGSEWVMPGRGTITKPFSASALNTALHGVNLPLEQFTIHDLRRTGATLLNEKGYSSDIVEKALNHKMTGVRGIYNRAEYAAQRKEMLQFWGSYVAGLATEKRVLVGNFSREA
jgi:integrase